MMLLYEDERCALFRSVPDAGNVAHSQYMDEMSSEINMPQRHGTTSTRALSTIYVSTTRLFSIVSLAAAFKSLATTLDADAIVQATVELFDLVQDRMPCAFGIQSCIVKVN
jgi:hypothetical protein